MGVFEFYFGGFLGIIAFILSLVFYFLPTIIALIRKQPNALAIFLLNFFLGWTFIGWVVCLVWAVAK
jgi:hypothetical protein